MTISEAINYYCAIMEAESASPRTIAGYRTCLRSLTKLLADRNVVLVSDLTPLQLRQAVARILNPQHEPRSFKGGEATANQVVFAARGLSRALRRDGIDMPDLSVVRAPRVPERIQKRVTGAEFRALEQAAVQQTGKHRPDSISTFRAVRDLAILYVLADTGLRASEFCGLDIGDLDIEAGTLLVRRGKRKKDRHLSILDPDPLEPGGGATMRALIEYLDRRVALVGARNCDGEALWVSAGRGSRLSTIELRMVISRMCRTAGLHGSRPPHAFRRAHFTENYQADPASLPILVARMGWAAADTEMVATYTRGAALDFARTHRQPSVAKRWHAGSAPTPVAAVQRESALTAELLVAVKGNPAFAEALLQALRGVA